MYIYEHLCISICKSMWTQPMLFRQVARDVCMIDSSTARLLELVTTSKSCAKSVLSLFKTTTSQVKSDEFSSHIFAQK